MPRRLVLAPELTTVLQQQRRVASREQLMQYGVTARAISYRLGSGAWREVHPSVYLLSDADPTRWQSLQAALLRAGPSAAIDAVDALAQHGVPLALPDARRPQVVIAWGEAERSREELWVRRTTRPIDAVVVDGLRTLAIAPAAVIAARRLSRASDVTALLSHVIQQRGVPWEALQQANELGPARGRPRVARLLADLAGGSYYAGEVAFMKLCRTSALLPEPEPNVWLRLPSGKTFCADALFREAALIHEVLGRKVHEREDLLALTAAREIELEAAGFTVVSSLPTRVRDEGAALLRQMEAIYLRNRGRGLPAGVVVLGGPPHRHRTA